MDNGQQIFEKRFVRSPSNSLGYRFDVHIVVGNFGGHKRQNGYLIGLQLCSPVYNKLQYAVYSKVFLSEPA